jgi:putative pyruvate formate lyase activating enzyme
MLSLQESGAHNLNLVTGTQFVPQILDALRSIRNTLHIPVVWNTGGYETEETVDALSEFVSVWLPDFKYASPDLAARLSGARNYPDIAERAIRRMYESTGAFRTDENGICTRGVLVRHLVLPGQRKDSCAVLDRLAALVPVDEIRLSLMWQYTPEFLPEGKEFDPLRRRVTTFEYDSVRRHADALGFIGYGQGRSSATKDYTPQFDCEASER